MTDQPGSSAPIRGSGGGRHYRRPSTAKRVGLAIGVVVAIVAVAGVITVIVRSGSGADDAASRPADGPGPGAAGVNSADGVPGSAGSSGCALTVAASPDIADAIGGVAAENATPGCAVTVTAVDSADFVSTWKAGGAAQPNVWIPDSSLWAALAAKAGVPVPATSESVATSPLVMALAESTAHRLSADGAPITVDALLETRSTAAPVRVGLPDPRQSAEAVGAILALRSAVNDQPAARAALTWGLRSSPADLPTTGDKLLAGIGQDPGTALPVSEQAVWAHNAEAGAARAVAVYPSVGATHLDYPFVLLGSGDAAASADQLLSTLLGEGGKSALVAAGFRDPEGVAGSALTAGSGVDPQAGMGSDLPDLSAVEKSIREVEVSNEPSRLLALMDISGSMQAGVPGAGGASRMTLAKQAASRGLSLYPPDSEIGLWVFSRDLTGTTDYREVVPVGSLGARSDGVTGEQRLAEALAATEAIPDGGTGLYDTTLQAVRTMQKGWDPRRVNAVLILSDGMNDDENSITLPDLLTTLKKEQDPRRPVPVISIAFGPDSDVDALTQISTATGGSTYLSQDPRDIGEIFLDAVGQRVCRPNCSSR